MSQVNVNTDHIKKNYKENIVLIGTGSYCPATKGHVIVFKDAKEQFERKYNMKVLGAYISPTQISTLKSKAKSGFFMSDETRTKLLEMTIKDFGCEDWLKVLVLDMNHTEKVKYISKILEEELKTPIRVLYVAGADHFRDCGCKELRKPNFGIGIIDRVGYEDVKIEGENVFHINLETEFEGSSTLIRKLISEKKFDELYKHQTKSVVDYEKEHDIFEKEI